MNNGTVMGPEQRKALADAMGKLIRKIMAIEEAAVLDFVYQEDNWPKAIIRTYERPPDDCIFRTDAVPEWRRWQKVRVRTVAPGAIPDANPWSMHWFRLV